MSKIELHFDLLPDKHTEFMQTWQTFIEHVRTNEGFDSFDLKQSNQHCDISLNWKSKESLNLFITSKWYTFLIGAVDVLATVSSKQISE